jgi:hypothetical protein
MQIITVGISREGYADLFLFSNTTQDWLKTTGDFKNALIIVSGMTRWNQCSFLKFRNLTGKTYETGHPCAFRVFKVCTRQRRQYHKGQ